MHENNNDNGPLLKDGLVNVGEASRFLGVCRASVYQLMAARKIPYIKIGRARRVPRNALIAFADGLLRAGEEGQ